MKTLQRGFTLIELLVVIAIIGILSSIVLASLSSARTKGDDAAISSTLSNMRAQAELFYSNNNGYGTSTTHATPFSCGSVTPADSIFGFTGGLGTLVTGLTNRNPASTLCKSTGTAWVVSTQLKTTGQTFCVDSLGTSKQGTFATALAAADTTNNKCN